MKRPRLLELFCGAGGAGMGYHRAGFDVVGVDIAEQPNYPFEFHQADALHVLADLGAWLDGTYLDSFDVIHASPPCQLYSIANNIHGRTDHPDLIAPTRELLVRTGLPYVIENVPGSPLRDYFQLCGRAFGLGVRRHRWFESNVFMMAPPCGSHAGDWLLVFGHTVLERGKQVGTTAKGGPIIRRRHVGVERGRVAMGISWMNRDELSEAIPPAYTEYIGGELLASLAGGTTA